MADQSFEAQYTAYARDGDLDALGELFDRVAPKLARLARRLAPDGASAEDLVQETFLTALERPGLYDPARPLLPWLLGILTHHARELRRREARRPEPERLAERDVQEPEAILADAELREAIREAVDELPDSLRGVVRGRLLEERRTQDLASELGLAPGALRMRLARGLARLRDALPADFASALAPLWALGLGHSVSGVSARSLARVRERVLAEAARRVPGAVGRGAVTLASGAGAAGASGAGVLMANYKLVAALGIAVLAAVGIRSWNEVDANRGRVDAPLSAEQVVVPDSRPGELAAPAETDGAAGRLGVPPAAGAAGPTLVVTVRHGQGATLPADLTVRATFSGDAEPGYWTVEVPLELEGSRGEGRLVLPAGVRLLQVAAPISSTTTAASVRQNVELGATGEHEVALAVDGGGSLQGFVVDLGGRPVAAARVEAWCRRSSDGEPDRVVFSDGRGRFRIEHLGPGFFAQASTSELVPIKSLEGSLAPGYEARGLQLVVGPGVVLRGRVLVPSGEPAAGAEVRVGGTHRLTWREETAEPEVITTFVGAGRAVADASGWFEVPGLSSGFHRVKVSLADFLLYTADASPAGDPLLIQLDAGLRLEGIVLDATGRPAVGALVTFGPYQSNLSRGPRTVHTDAEGRFQLVGLPRTPVFGGSSTWRGARWIRVAHEGSAIRIIEPLPPAEDGDLVVHLAPACAVAGRIVDGEGEPVRGARVWIDDGRQTAPSNRSMLGWYISQLQSMNQGSAISGSGGSFRIDQLERKSYVLHVTPPSAPELDVTLPVDGGDLDLEIELGADRTRGVLLSGVATDALTGEPLADYQIVVRWGVGAEIYEIADPEGRFAIEGLTPGLLYLDVDAPGYVHESLPEREYEQGLHVLELSLFPSRGLVLELVDPLGTPVGGAMLSVLDRRRRALSFGMSTGGYRSSFFVSGGSAILESLPAKALVLQVDVDGEVDEFAVDLTSPYEGVLTLVIGR